MRAGRVRWGQRADFYDLALLAPLQVLPSCTSTDGDTL
jgi:hypothetical protein